MADLRAVIPSGTMGNKTTDEIRFEGLSLEPPTRDIVSISRYFIYLELPSISFQFGLVLRCTRSILNFMPIAVVLELQICQSTLNQSQSHSHYSNFIQIINKTKYTIFVFKDYNLHQSDFEWLYSTPLHSFCKSIFHEHVVQVNLNKYDYELWLDYTWENNRKNVGKYLSRCNRVSCFMLCTSKHKPHCTCVECWLLYLSLRHMDTIGSLE